MSGTVAIIPVCLQVPHVFDQFRANLRTLRDAPVSRLIVVCNRLSLMRPEVLHSFLATDVPFPLEVVCDKERSVAGAWNRGIEIGLEMGHETFLITAVDVALRHGTVSRLCEFGQAHPETLLWSSRANDSPVDESIEAIDACDFSCFMLRKATIEKIGWFDKEFKPAYFEKSQHPGRRMGGHGDPHAPGAVPVWLGDGGPAPSRRRPSSHPQRGLALQLPRRPGAHRPEAGVICPHRSGPRRTQEPAKTAAAG